MHNIKNVIQDRKLVDVIIPGTHDAGMSKITGAILSGGIELTTRTQGLSIYEQLRAGSRWFDLRVQSVHQVAPSCCDDYKFWTMHIK